MNYCTEKAMHISTHEHIENTVFFPHTYTILIYLMEFMEQIYRFNGSESLHTYRIGYRYTSVFNRSYNE